ncbi:hypothetical protein FKW77_001843 [Venturia effusa]|uniref:DNA-directed RNA polymerase III subunit RPC9 n=1 Tax=Venturia effusa TaxID=50376 RepID=A0A517L8P7_9PEZI|nr:hypothetical protein FKW77_001843 [Venturia effusa]
MKVSQLGSLDGPEILNAGTRLLTNNEVLQHVEGLKAKYKTEGREKSIPNNLKDMLKNVSEILTLDPQTGQRTRTPISNTQIAKLASILAREPYKLLSTEIAGIMNQVPRNSIELCLIVEEGEERFSEEQLEEMVGLVERYLVEAPVVKEVERGDEKGKGAET